MSLWARSVRCRLTAWFVVALCLFLLAFSLGIYTLVRSSLWRQMDRRLDDDLLTVETILREQPDELIEMGEHGTIRLLCVRQGCEVLYETREWETVQLDPVLESVTSDSFRFWTSPAGKRYRVRVASLQVQDDSYVMAMAQDVESIHDSLRTLLLILVISAPCMLVLAVIGGYVLAGRVLSPIGAMAFKAQEITADRLAERLPVDNPNDEFGRLATVFNATLARLQDSFDRLRRFTADASHELRTPLTALRSVGEVGLHEELDPAAYRDVIGSMLEEVDRLASLVDNLLTLTRVDSGRMILSPQPVDLGELVQEVVDCLGVLAEERDQDLRVELEPDVHARADRVTLRQGLINLLDNAIKYTETGGRILLKTAKMPDGQVTVDITDNGPGIAREHGDAIFDRFYRIEPERSSETGGVGLGLAIARHVVEINGGRIELDSALGQGSRFRVVLPGSGFGCGVNGG